MLTGKENGAGSAHPQLIQDFNMGVAHPATEGGLTKREAFAMAALQGALANSAAGGFVTDKIAGIAVQAADRLLAELAKETP